MNLLTAILVTLMLAAASYADTTPVQPPKVVIAPVPGTQKSAPLPRKPVVTLSYCKKTNGAIEHLCVPESVHSCLCAKE